MIDHAGLTVTDIARSKAFFRAALAPLGYSLLVDGKGYAGFGVPPKPDFWLGQGAPKTSPIHVAFRADTRAQVDAFHRAALTAGGQRRPGTSTAVSQQLLRRARVRPRRTQRRGRLSRARMKGGS